jgi:UDP-N-acetylglucosamine--N-acetylmuramyl-(pentapeptide) pyrophosphoryl-undecaprenol N-acetylglucosamine transferase
MKVVIAGGGTGGHLFPGIALAEELTVKRSGHEVLFLGAHGGLEERLLPKLGYKLELLPSLKGGFRGLRGLGCLRALGVSYVRARRILLRYKPDVAVGLGGYASVAPLLAAWGVEIPSLLLEQNMIPGRANRRLAWFATEVGVQFAASAHKFPSPKRVRHAGNPLRLELLKAAAATAERNTAPSAAKESPTLLVLGGSQGARALNEIAIRAWPKLNAFVPKMKMILVAGENDYERTRRAFASADVRGRIVPFCERMEELYAQADVVLARAGATTLAELAVFALPSILIPYPHAADDHQTANAQLYAGAGAAWCIAQNEIETDRLARRIADVALQPERRRQMALAAQRLGKPHAAEEIVERLSALAGLRPNVHTSLRVRPALS